MGGGMIEFADKNILVVGASSGMGRGLSRRLAAEGAQVAVSARRAGLLESLVAEIKGAGGKALAIPADGSDEVQAASVVSDVIEAFGHIDMVVLNAGGAPALDLTKMTVAEIRGYMESNYYTVINYLVPVLAHMSARGSGTIVHTNSGAGFIGVPLQGPYCAAKGAARLLIDTARIEYAHLGVKFTTLYPGFVATEATQGDGMPAPDEISEQEAVDYMIEAIRREDWDCIFPPAHKEQIEHALEVTKEELAEGLRRIFLTPQTS